MSLPAKASGHSNSFKENNGITGVDWYQGLLSRHAEIFLRKPETTSAACAIDFDKDDVSYFFDLLTEIIIISSSSSFKVGHTRTVPIHNFNF